MEFIISLLPTMKSTTCVSSQAGRQMRWEEEGEEEEEEHYFLGIFLFPLPVGWRI